VRLVDTPRVLDADAATELVGQRAPAMHPTPELMLTDGQPVGCRDENGDVVLVIARMPDDVTDEFHGILPGMKMRTTLRSGAGYRNQSLVFGYHPRRPVLRRESCKATLLSATQPELSGLIRRTASWAGSLLGQELPGTVEHDRATLAPVLSDWRLDDGDGDLWTSGVINKDSPMPYHRDGSNFPTWSAMPVIRSNTLGGRLHLPEYGLSVPCSDGTCVFWWGERIVHGVTPMTVRRGGYRFSVVYYAMRGMKDCATFAVEQAEGARRRAVREVSIAADIRERKPANS
jgi:hypothetical protein